MGPGLERSPLTQVQIARAETRVDFSHPVIVVLEAHGPQITRLNEGWKLFPDADQRGYIYSHMDFIANAVEDSGEFSLEPLDLVAVWSKAMEVFDSRYERYALARIVAVSYAIQGVENPAWRRSPRHFIENVQLPREALADRVGLQHVKSRLQEVVQSRNELIFYIHGTRGNAMQLGIELAKRVKEGDAEAELQLNEFRAYNAEHATPVLREIAENFSNSMPVINNSIEAALMAVPSQPSLKALELASMADEVYAIHKIREHVQFGNNFYLLFHTIKHIDQWGPGQAAREISLQRLQSLGETWTTFTGHNKGLLAEIDIALDDLAVYGEILDHQRNLLREKKWDEKEVFSKSIHPDLGGEAVGLVVWSHLNPLLERAAEAMKEAGINPQEFYG